MSPQVVTFSVVKDNDKSFLIQNMILMVFKLFVYKPRVSRTLNSNTFLHQLVKVKNLEKGAAFNSKQKHESLKNTLERGFFGKFASLLAETWRTDEFMFCPIIGQLIFFSLKYFSHQNLYFFQCVFSYDQFYLMEYHNYHLLKDTQVHYL